MAATTYETGRDWSASARYTAAADLSVLIANPGRAGVLRFTTTLSDALPTLPVAFAVPLGPGDRQSAEVPSGTRIWFAGGPVAVVEV